MTAPCLAITSGLPTTRGIDLLGNLHLELHGFSRRMLAPVGAKSYRCCNH